MITKQLGPLNVSAMGLGCMGISEFYGESLSEDKSIRLLKLAYNNGVNLFDTADVYGFGDNEILVGKAVNGNIITRK